MFDALERPFSAVFPDNLSLPYYTKIGKPVLAAENDFGRGFLVAGLGVALHSLWLVYLGCGMLGGIGLGSGFSPRISLMSFFVTSTSVGVAETMLFMGAISFAFVMCGIFTMRVPALGWKPAGFIPSTQARALVP